MTPGSISRNIPWRREGLPSLVFLPGEFHGQSSLVGRGEGESKGGGDTDSRHLIRGLKSDSTHTQNLKTKVLNAVLSCCSDISPAEIGLFGASRELKFRVCKHGVSQMDAQQGKENSLIEGKEIYKLQETGPASHWLRPCREEDASFSSCWALPSAQGSLFWARSSN